MGEGKSGQGSGEAGKEGRGRGLGEYARVRTMCDSIC